MYVGVNLQARRFFDEGMSGRDIIYAQTARRATRAPLAPFSVDTDDGYAEWLRLVKAFSAHIKLADADPAMMVPLTKELYRRTQGHIGTLTNLLDHANHVAVRTGVERITREVLDQALADNAAEHRAAS